METLELTSANSVEEIKSALKEQGVSEEKLSATDYTPIREGVYNEAPKFEVNDFNGNKYITVRFNEIDACSLNSFIGSAYVGDMPKETAIKKSSRGNLYLAGNTNLSPFSTNPAFAIKQILSVFEEGKSLRISKVDSLSLSNDCFSDGKFKAPKTALEYTKKLVTRKRNLVTIVEE